MEDEIQASPRARVDAGAEYSGNAAGQAMRGQGAIQIAGIPIILGAGGGILNLDYLSHPLGYAAGDVSLDTNIGLRGHIYGQATLAAFPRTSETVPQFFEAVRVGSTYDIIPKKGKAMFRVGLEGFVKLAEAPGGLDQLYQTVGGGASFGYGPLVAYGIGRLTFGPSTPIQQFWVDALRPWPEEMKVGARVDIREGTEAGAELSATYFERGGRLFFNLRSLPLPTQLSLVYRHTTNPLGRTHEIGGSAAVSLDRRIARIMVSARQEFGGESLGRYERQSVGDMDSRALAGFLYGTGRIDLAEYVKRIHPDATIGSLEMRTHAGRTYTVVNYWINGVPGSFSAGTDPERQKRAIGQRARTALGDSAYNFLESLFSSDSLEQFAGRYSGSSTDQKIYAAARLAALGHEGYDYHLEGASFFSSEKKKLETLDPDTVFANIRKSLRENRTIKDGICGNINGMAAEFLRLSGVEAYTLGVGSGDTMHAIAAARDPGSNSAYVVDYGSVYKTRSGGIWPATQAYAKENGLIILGAYVYGEKNRFMGYYKGPEGRLMDTALRTDEDSLREALIRR